MWGCFWCGYFCSAAARLVRWSGWCSAASLRGRAFSKSPVLGDGAKLAVRDACYGLNGEGQLAEWCGEIGFVERRYDGRSRE